MSAQHALPPDDAPFPIFYSSATSLSDVTCQKVSPLEFQTKVTEPPFFTFVVSTFYATILSTCVLGVVA